MAKSLKPYILIALGLAAVSSVYLLYTSNRPATEVQSTVNETEQATEQEVAAVEPEPEEEPAAPVEEQAVGVPSFSILRVEPDGSAVVGGSGPASSEIELFNGNVSLGKTTTGPEGDFVFVLDKPLEQGLNQLSLTATTESGEKIVSAESGIVNVPEPGKEDELTVVVTAEGQATRVMSQASEATTEQASTEEVAEQEIASVSSGTLETAQESTSSSSEASEDTTTSQEPVSEPEAEAEAKTDVSNVEVNTETDNVSVSVKSEDESAQPSATTAPVLIEAADIEGEKIFIAGTGEAGMNVNIYLGGEFLGRTKVSEYGAFLFEGRRQISAGTYDIRADMTGSGGSEVLARAQVKLIHEPEQEQVKESVEVAKAEETETQAAEVEVQAVEETETQAAEAEAQATETETQTAQSTVANDSTSESSASSTSQESSGESSQEATAESTQVATAQESENQNSGSTEETVAASSEEEESAAVEENGESTAAQETDSGEQETTDKVIRTGTAVIIRKGDNLWRIARRNYGAGIRYTTIFDANRDQIQDPNLIFPGQVFKVPDDEGDENQG